MKEALLDELVKLGAVSDEHAQHALERLDSLDRNKPTVGQLGRYAGIGAVAAPAISAVGNVVRGRSPFEGDTVKKKLREAAATAVKGGLSASVIPLARVHSDRNAQIGTLKKYLDERGPKTAGVLDSVGRMLTTEIPGTPQLFARRTPALSNIGRAGGAFGAAGTGARTLAKAAPVRGKMYIRGVPVESGVFRKAPVKLGSVKVALPRYEREIQAGNITRGDVVPGSPDVRGGLLGPSQRAKTRATLVAPASVQPGEVAHTRALKEKLYAAQTGSGAKALGVSANIKREPLAGMVAGTAPGLLGPPTVHAPEISGQLVRGLTGGFVDRAKTMGGALTQQDSLFVPKAPVDATLNHAVLQHELGEASEMAKSTVRPFASHLGPEPILRENIGVLGDPEAQAAMGRLRQVHPDDALVQRMVRRAGGTPNAPIPLGGAQHRAVDRMLDRSASLLSPETRQKAMTQELGQQLGHRATGSGTGFVPKHVGYIPKDLAQKIGPSLDAGEQVVSHFKNKAYLSAAAKGKDVLKGLGRAVKFIRKGV